MSDYHGIIRVFAPILRTVFDFDIPPAYFHM